MNRYYLNQTDCNLFAFKYQGFVAHIVLLIVASKQAQKLFNRTLQRNLFLLVLGSHACAQCQPRMREAVFVSKDVKL